MEIQSAFAMKVRSGVLSRDAAGMGRARFLVDVAAGDIEVYRITDEHFSAAKRLIGQHAFSTRLRTLDALQLAVALDLAEQSLLDHFVIADSILAAIASVEGIKVINPAP